MQKTKPLKLKKDHAARDVRRGYPLDWPIRSWFVRVIRARNRCEWCGARKGEPHPVTGSRVIIGTAHVYDRTPAAASLLNLAALCQRCHLNHDRAEHIQTRRANKDRPMGSLASSRPGRRGGVSGAGPESLPGTTTPLLPATIPAPTSCTSSSS